MRGKIYKNLTDISSYVLAYFRESQDISKVRLFLNTLMNIPLPYKSVKSFIGSAKTKLVYC